MEKESMKVKKKIKKSIRNTILLVLSIVLFIFSFIFIKKGFNSCDFIQLNYYQKTDVDYKVFLKPNNFFEKNYLEKNKKYITSLIDFFDVSFNYTTILEDIKSGSYTYYIKGVLSANLQNSDEAYWTKEYTLLEPVTESFKDLNVINVARNIKINYDEYNNLLGEFKKAYSLSMDGKLSIYMYVDLNVNDDVFDEEVKNETIMSMSIPLTQATIEVPIEVNAPNNQGTLASKIDNSNSKTYLIYKIVGFGLLLFGTLIIVFVALDGVKHQEINHKYYKQLKHILKTYDSIIVTVKSLPNFNEVKIIDVSNFSELIDAHSELRLPINYSQEKNRAVFVLFNDKMAWRFILYKEVGE